MSPRLPPRRASARAAVTSAVIVLLATLGLLTAVAWSRTSPATTSVATGTAPEGDAVGPPPARATTLDVQAARADVVASDLVSVTATVAPADVVTPPTGSPSGPPTGTVTFTDEGALLTRQPLEEGRATFATNELAVGRHEVTASYGGDAAHLASTAHVVLTVQAPRVDGFTGLGVPVAVAGDSITLGSKDDITAALRAAGTDPSVVGLYGYTTTSAKPFVDAFVLHSPAIVIIELGTNDITEIVSGVPGRTAAGLRQRMQAITASFPSACVAVTTVTAHRVQGSPGVDPQRWNEEAQAYDDWLRATYPVVIDWDRAIQDARAKGEPIIQPDELHPTAAGARALATLDLLATSRCLDTAAPAPAP